jgi:hypothetical protein
MRYKHEAKFKKFRKYSRIFLWCLEVPRCLRLTVKNYWIFLQKKKTKKKTSTSQDGCTHAYIVITAHTYV